MKPIALIIRDTQAAIIKAVNESQLPASILEQIIAPIHQQIAQAAQAEIAQAEKEYKESEEQKNA